MIYGLAEAVPVRDRKCPSGVLSPPLTGIVCLCMDAFLSGRGRGPCDQRPLPVDVFVEVEAAFVEVEAAFAGVEAAFAFETPIFL